MAHCGRVLGAEQCRRRGLNPQTHLTDILTRLPVINITEINRPLPGQWKSSSVNTKESESAICHL
jgi:hypothetical protein